MKHIAVAAAILLVVAHAARAGAPEPSPLLAQLVAGQHVKVEGTTTAGVFRAIQITLRDPEATAKIEGAIEVISSDRRQLQVLGFAVVLDAVTKLYRGSQISGSRSILSRGGWVEVKGSWRNGVLKATRIRLKESPEPTEEVEGLIESSDAGTSALMILDRRIIIEPGAAITDERTGRSPVSSLTDRLRRDDDDSSARAPIAFGNVVLGGRMEAGYLDERNFRDGDIERTMLSRTQVLASSQITDTIEAYGKATFSGNMAVGGGALGDARLSEAYLLFHEVGGSRVDVQIGRQRFRDSREWFYDEYLDAARVRASFSNLRVEAAVSQGIHPAPRDRRARRDQLQMLASASMRLGGAKLAFHSIARRDNTRGERPVWFGATVDGKAGIRWSYWSDTAVRRGTATAGRLGGWATDGGIRHKWMTSATPTVTLAYAFGSGDPMRGDGRDTRFRQTDLEDNQSYFGGLRRVALYGELFDAELSNLHVITAGLGLQPRRGLAIDAIYHEFFQAVASTSLPSGNLEGALTGRDRALGRELDVVITLRVIRGLDIDAATGLFIPGTAFGTRASPAFFWRPQLRFYF